MRTSGLGRVAVIGAAVVAGLLAAPASVSASANDTDATIQQDATQSASVVSASLDLATGAAQLTEVTWT